jgi:DNA polymerase-3 subunit gamma/tau
MSYTALARRWRPHRFDDLVGQEHVVRALSNALDSQRVHHAFLFTGTRGVGKTTIARIFAKCLNCDEGVSARPCGVCASCREVEEGRFIDLIEVDAASRTKVDDTRELLENVQYAPSRGRYKVYLIDEVHMLSQHSFNALLKTLEEPPPHVKFLLATTDPQKLPITVLSRCLQFNLKRLPVSLIIERLKHVLEADSLPYEPAALRLIAEAADGSLRDALSLLDQLLAFAAGRAAEAEARAMLGTVDRGQVVELLRRLAAGDAVQLIAHARSLEEWAPDHAALLDAMAGLLARVALCQTVPDAAADETYPVELLRELAAQLSPEDTHLYYQIATLGRRDIVWAPDARTGFEMTLLRMLAFRPAGLDGDGARASRSGAAAGGAGTAPAGKGAGGTSSAGLSAAAAATEVASGSMAALPADNDAWIALLPRLDLGGAARQLGSHCEWQGIEGGTVRLAIDPRNQHLRTRALEDKLAQALSKCAGQPLKIDFVATAAAAPATPAAASERAANEELAAARRSLADDPTVQGLQQRFGAVLHEDTVRPNRGARPGNT